MPRYQTIVDFSYPIPGRFPRRGSLTGRLKAASSSWLACRLATGSAATNEGPSRMKVGPGGKAALQMRTMQSFGNVVS